MVDTHHYDALEKGSEASLGCSEDVHGIAASFGYARIRKRQ